VSSQAAQPSTGAVSAPPNQLIDQGQNFATYQHVEPVTDLDGQVRFLTNRFTLLENNLNYLDNGRWKLSEDVIESFPGGAIARRGPDQAVFASDLNAEAVFDILASDGKRIRGGLRAIQVTDLATGKRVIQVK
jgi:hypothetical protein